MSQLGKGATAYVYKVRSRSDQSETPKCYALKVIDKEKIKKLNLDKRVKNEIEIHLTLNEHR